MGSRFLTTEALILGSMRYREADRIVTLYTRDRGRLGALAKGVRRTKSKVGGRLEPFSLVRVSLYSGRSLYTIVGVDTLRTFQGVRDELFRMEEGPGFSPRSVTCFPLRRVVPRRSICWFVALPGWPTLQIGERRWRWYWRRGSSSSRY